MLFKIVWFMDAIGTLVVLYFFFVGLADGTVSERNMGQWSLILLLCAAVLGGSYWLRTHNHPGLALLVTFVLGLPALAFLAFILIGVNSKWN